MTRRERVLVTVMILLWLVCFARGLVWIAQEVAHDIDVRFIQRD